MIKLASDRETRALEAAKLSIAMRTTAVIVGVIATFALVGFVTKVAHL